MKKRKMNMSTLINEVVAKLKKYPKGFLPIETDKEDDKVYGGQIIAAYDAPMEGWDEDNRDMVLVVKKKMDFMLMDI